MSPARLMTASCLALVLGIAAYAQDTPDFPEPTEEHEWLAQFAGEWDTVSEGTAGPDQPAFTVEGSMTSRRLGGFWIVNEISNESVGAVNTGIQTIGYDPDKERYVGTWVDSMTNTLWHYEGTVDESGKILTLETEGPNIMVPGETALYRDIYEFKSPDHIIATSAFQDDDGNWIPFMTGHMRRRE